MDTLWITAVPRGFNEAFSFRGSGLWWPLGRSQMRGSKLLVDYPSLYLVFLKAGACLMPIQTLGEKLALSGLDPNVRNWCGVTSDPEKCLGSSLPLWAVGMIPPKSRKGVREPLKGTQFVGVNQKPAHFSNWLFTTKYLDASLAWELNVIKFCLLL